MHLTFDEYLLFSCIYCKLTFSQCTNRKIIYKKALWQRRISGERNIIIIPFDTATIFAISLIEFTYCLSLRVVNTSVSRYIIWGVNQFSICGGKDAPYLNSVAAQSLFWYKWHIGHNDDNIFNLDKPIVNSLPYLGSRGKPRSARRARKPLQDNWPKTPVGKWLRCTYTKCGFKWQYFGGRNWAECPLCHSTMKVAIAKRNYYTLANKEWIFVLC